MGCKVLHDGRAATATTNSLNYKSLEELNISGGCQTLLSLLETKLLSRLEIRNVVDIQCLPNCSRLQHLTLSNCPTLSSFPKLTSLDYLCIQNSCDSMRSFPLGIFPKLTRLEIHGCENLESLSLIEEEGAVENLSHLNYLLVYKCPKMVYFHEGELPTPNLSHFVVGGCENLKSLPKSLHTLTALRSLSIRNLPNLESFAEDGGLPPNLRSFSIGNCKRLRASSVGLQALDSLEISGSDHVLETLLLPTTLHTLRIYSLSTLKSLDGKGLGHLTSLQELEINSCPSLEFLPGEELQHLTSLQTLIISSCGSLQCLPEEDLPSSLSHLSISRCPALEKRYKNKTGQDWAKISHIPCIKIGYEVII